MRIRHHAQPAPDVGIDFGTSSTLVVERGHGVVFDQPSICCFKNHDFPPSLVAAGTEARRYAGRAPKPLKILHPLREGVVSDVAGARELLTFVRKTACRGRRLRRVRAVIGVPADATHAERRALSNAAVDAGFAEPRLVEEPVLAAIGLGGDVGQPRGRMVVDCGAGTTEVVIISLGCICVSRSVRGGGEALDQALTDHLKSRYRFHIGAASAESMKLELSSMLAAGDAAGKLEVRGLDAATGLPRSLAIMASDFLRVWERQADQIVQAVAEALAETPPELSHDVLEEGIMLTGGAALTGLLAGRIASRTGVRTEIAAAPLHTVALGLQRLIEGSHQRAN
jgi:rod shape-determining protein MreB and related proteins